MEEVARLQGRQLRTVWVEGCPVVLRDGDR
jgi:hypothetical protein